MQKKQTPLVMIALLVIMLGVVGVLNSGKKADGQPPPPEPGKEAVGQKMAAPTKDAVAKSLEKKDGPTPPDEAMMKTNRPSILKQTYGAAKPTVNDASTTSQWYTGKSHIENEKK